MNNDIKKVQPFDSFSEVCKILVWSGYYKPLNKPTTQLKRISHQIYRVLALLFVAVYNVQHLIFTVQHRHDMAKLIDCLVIEIPQINLFAKALNMLASIQRIDKLQEVLTGPIFAANDEHDENILKKNKLEMDRLNRILIIGVAMTGSLWPCSLFANRYYDQNEVVNSYMPFNTDTWPRFALSVLLETGPIFWTGLGHISIDHLIAAYYAHAQAQLKIIKSQLQRLGSSETNDDNIQDDGNIQKIGSKNISLVFSQSGKKIQNEITHFSYTDFKDKAVYQRFVQIVKRYETLAWFTKEVDDVFNFPLTVQFISTVTVVCLVVFRMSALSVTSIPFFFLALLFFLLQLQVLMYCYYGNLLEFESIRINESLYSSDWVSLSPQFRRSLLIAMCRWSRPIQPRICGIVPLSLGTFVQILKTSYTLYTVLVVASKPESKE